MRRRIILAVLGVFILIGAGSALTAEDVSIREVETGGDTTVTYSENGNIVIDQGDTVTFHNDGSQEYVIEILDSPGGGPDGVQYMYETTLQPGEEVHLTGLSAFEDNAGGYYFRIPGSYIPKNGDITVQ